MANTLIITTPRGVLWQSFNQFGEVKVRLDWNPDFGRKMTASFNKAQAYIDSEVLRFCSSRVPFDTGMLQKSGILGTTVGSGEVVYLAPYAARQYYKTKQTRAYDANRGGMWFERGKAVERERILRGAKKIAGGG
ncbi:minor capsid protein [Eubacteriales bacterium OttesenSCG-928-A19]|nr:minor capsid protein [Eubacteriales bacterium OttesenSCG-928-A19]